jgi:dipeptidase E
MRIYLSSFLLGNEPSQLVRLSGEKRRCALILNALDNAPEARTRFLESQTAGLEALGFSVRELDLRCYFAAPEQLGSDLAAFDVLWVTGGNAFILRKAMRQSTLDTTLPTLLARNELVYAGFSAAAVIAGADLKALTPSPASFEPLAGYANELIWEGLNILPFALVVHHDSDHPGRAAAAEEAAYHQWARVPHRLLRDGEALVIDGSRTFIAGSRDSSHEPLSA